MATDSSTSSDHTTGLKLWTVYKNLLDYPGQYVARLFLNDKPTDTVIISANYLIIENHMLLLQLHRLPRSPDDEPHIMECWL